MTSATDRDGTSGETALAAPRADGTSALTKDDIFHLLQNERRRRVVSYLLAHDEGEGIDMRTMTEWIAAQEHDTTMQALRSKERQRVYIALYQSHLPKLDAADVIEYDQRKGWVERTDLTPVVGQYISGDGAAAPPEPESAHRSPGSYIPFLAIGASGVLLVLGLTGSGPFTGWALAFALFAVLLALALWNNRRLVAAFER